MAGSQTCQDFLRLKLYCLTRVAKCAPILISPPQRKAGDVVLIGIKTKQLDSKKRRAWSG